MGRILELKNEMVLLEFSEYHYFDDVLSDLKLTPVSSFNLIWNMEIVIYMYADLIHHCFSHEMTYEEQAQNSILMMMCHNLDLIS